MKEMKRLKKLCRVGIGLTVLLSISVSCSNPCREECVVGAIVIDRNIIKTACEIYRLDCGTYPTSTVDLITSPGIRHWSGGYLNQNKVPEDPWGTPYSYRLVNGSPVIDSAGPDRAFGTEDDNGAGIHPRTRGRLRSCRPFAEMTLNERLVDTGLRRIETDIQLETYTKGLRLKQLTNLGKAVSNLHPIAHMPIEYLDISYTSVYDLEPLREMPLTYLSLTGNRPFTNASVLGSIPTLRQLNLTWDGWIENDFVEGTNISRWVDDIIRNNQ
jgi:hypothetical protein